MTDRNGPEGRDLGLEESRRFLAGGPTPLTRGMVGGHASFTLSEETMERLGALSEELDAPLHIHVAEDPADVEDCFHATVAAFNIAEEAQMPVIVLSDQFIAQRRETLSMLTLDHEVIGRQVPSAGDLREYKRYKETKSGISPMSWPGMKGGEYQTNGLEHKAEIVSAIEDLNAGGGKLIDVSLAHAAVSWLHTFTPMLDMGSPPAELRRNGNKHRQFIPVNAYRTEDGFVYRVDTRLRPYGHSGPLVMNFNALENYYQMQGREWERYAMIKARVVAGDREAGESLSAMLRPFVYRRYLDFGAFESLREMKAKIVQEVKRLGLADNIKLGAGGIREIEFIVQAFQLVRGGRQPVLPHRRQQRRLPSSRPLPSSSAADLHPRCCGRRIFVDVARSFRLHVVVGRIARQHNGIVYAQFSRPERSVG